MRLFPLLTAVISAQICAGAPNSTKNQFDVMEATVASIHAAFQSGKLTARQLTQMYLDRIEAFDRNGPKINSVINVNPRALEDAAQLDAAYKKSGPVGPLHGIPIVLKDQMDAAGIPTTLGSLVMKDYVPTKDSFVVAKLRKAGAIILAKVTLGELGAGDSYGSLYGETHNPYDLARTPGGSSGGTGASVSANFAALGIGQEGFASIRRPSTWNSIVGMRPTPGLVSRGGVWGGYPSPVGSLGPMCRTVTDMAKLLDVMVGYDPDDPVTALGYGQAPDTYTRFLDKNGLKGARIGVLRQPMGNATDTSLPGYKQIADIFSRAVNELKSAGAEVVDPITIPRLNELLATRSMGGGGERGSGIDGGAIYFSRNPNSPFKTTKDLMADPRYKLARKWTSQEPRNLAPAPEGMSYQQARDELMTAVLKIMADYKLDAIVHTSNEHPPTLIKDGINPPYVNMKGSPHLNTFLIHAASIAVPAGFTEDGLPGGITFFGRPYSEPVLIKFAYAYEQATHHRVPPKTTPALPARTASR
ncbi:MAG: amidase family protein [Bryobacteraceae bacterium]